MRFLNTVFAVLLAMSCMSVNAEEVDYRPVINGTVRAKYEYEPQISAGRFEVRNARMSITGKILPVVGYKVEIDLSDEGRIRMLDAYCRLSARSFRGSLTAGQMRVPFTIDAHRSPHQQYFANRSFIAKQVGNVRDVGLTGMYGFVERVPITLEAGIFNGSGLTDQKNFWTKRYNFSVKATAVVDNVTVVAGCQRISPDSVGIMMWDIGAFYDDTKWHIEGEYLRKNYSGKFSSVNAVDAFVARRFPLKRIFSGISALGRYDYMSDHSDGVRDDSGNLVINDHGRHRMTLGATLHWGSRSMYADLRINYEQYFYKPGITSGISDRNKIVIELMCRF